MVVLRGDVYGDVGGCGRDGESDNELGEDESKLTGSENMVLGGKLFVCLLT